MVAEGDRTHVGVDNERIYITASAFVGFSYMNEIKFLVCCRIFIRPGLHIYFHSSFIDFK
jgi:hypothetical protein